MILTVAGERLDIKSHLSHMGVGVGCAFSGGAAPETHRGKSGDCDCIATTAFLEPGCND